MAGESDGPAGGCEGVPGSTRPVWQITGADLVERLFGMGWRIFWQRFRKCRVTTVNKGTNEHNLKTTG